VINEQVILNADKESQEHIQKICADHEAANMKYIPLSGATERMFETQIHDQRDKEKRYRK